MRNSTKAIIRHAAKLRDKGKLGSIVFQFVNADVIYNSQATEDRFFQECKDYANHCAFLVGYVTGGKA